MKTPFFSAFFTLAILFGSPLSSWAQEAIQVGKVDVKIEYDTQDTPVFEAAGVKTKKIPYPRNWLEIEVKFDVDARPRDAVIPKLMFKYYVAIQSKEGPAQLLTGEVNHVNIVSGEDSYSCAYVSPASLGKITGDFRRFQKSSVIAVAVAVFYNGELKGGASEGKGSGKWWEQMAGSPGIISKDKTPFALLWLDRYSDVEQPTR